MLLIDCKYIFYRMCFKIFIKYSKKSLSLLKVGALTNKAYKFKQRIWELNNFFSLDFTNNFLKGLVYSYNLKNFYLKVLSLNNWITNNIRFGAEGLKFKRNEKKSLFFKRIKKFSLYFLFLFFCKKFFKWDYSFNVFFNGDLNIENLIIIKMFFKKLGNTFFNFRVFGDFSYNNFISNDSINLYTLKLDLKKFNEMDCLVLIGINLRLENPILNLELRKIYKEKNDRKLIYSFFNLCNTTYKVNILGLDLKSLYKFIEGKHKFCTKFYNTERPLILIGTSLLNLKISEKIIYNLENMYHYVSLLRFNKEKKEIIWNGINLLHYNNLDIISRDLGIQNKVNYKKYKNIMYLLFNHNIFNNKQIKLLYNKKNLKEKKFKPIIIYFSSFYNNILKNLLVLNFNIIDIIEGKGTYMSNEGITHINTGLGLKNYKDNRYVYTDENNKLVYLFVCFFKLFFKYNLYKSDLTEIYFRYSGFLDIDIEKLRNKSYLESVCTYMIVFEFLYHIFLYKKKIHYIKNNIFNEYKFNEVFVGKFKHGLINIHRHSLVLIKGFFINKRQGREKKKYNIINKIN